MKKALFICLFLAVSLFSACGRETGDNLFAAKSYVTDAALVDEIRLELRDRQISVAQSPDEDIHIFYRESGSERYSLRLDPDGVLSMRLSHSGALSGYLGMKPGLEDRSVCLQIPDGALPRLLISTTNADVCLSQLAFTDGVQVSLNNGDLTFQLLDVAHTFSAEVKNGHVSGSLLGSCDLFSMQCRVKKGDCNLPASKAEGSRSLILDVNNGDIQVGFASA